jgi:hypothetical protein
MFRERTDEPSSVLIIPETSRELAASDNGDMPMVPAGYVHLGHLDAVVKEAASLLGPEVVHVTYRTGPDSTDEPSIFFRIVLTDAAIREETIVSVTRRIADVLLAAVRPLENWGLRPYFNYRSKSEQDQRRDPDWE